MKQQQKQLVVEEPFSIAPIHVMPEHSLRVTNMMPSLKVDAKVAPDLPSNDSRPPAVVVERINPVPVTEPGFRFLGRRQRRQRPYLIPLDHLFQRYGVVVLAYEAVVLHLVLVVPHVLQYGCSIVGALKPVFSAAHFDPLAFFKSLCSRETHFGDVLENEMRVALVKWYEESVCEDHNI